ncbi:hypothetical protein FSP39_006225 [Pinctada imbricata]|uniref:Uncharacterized protein n=1 Tax=Pinctada imbricata TaxID=66713 RepID=A0AA88YPZ6_PINIB|nr:hypothetical protein FSP39_006225 [Pinctada imbricata]
MEFKMEPDYIVEKAFKHLKESLADEIGKLSKQEIQRVREAMSIVSKNYLELKEKAQDGKAPAECLSHLDEDHVKLIKGSLENQTYEMTLTDMEATFSFRGNTLEYPTRTSLRDGEGADQAGKLQVASIIIESLIFVLNVGGISVPGGAGRREVVERVIEILERFPTLYRIIARMAAASRRGNVREIVEDIFQIVRILWEGGAFWSIIKLIFGSMSLFDWIETAAKIAAEIVAVVGTAGTAFIAELVIQVANAVNFIRKLNNLTMLSGRSAMLNSFLY